MSNQRQLFQLLFEENSNRIYHLCYGYTGDSDSANDLMQETFIKVWQNLDKFRNQSQFSTWIYRIAINTCLSYLRSAKRRATDELNDSIIENYTEEPSEKQEQIAQLYKSIAQLEENERIIITMVLDEVPYAEIAEVAGISEGNLRVKIHRIKHKLTEIYNSNERV
ncbi:RNA polymerase sigma factor [Parapedobacter sp. 10938]|uniref:RNA polymerase sigma factor n=1 Tax=Parapedobacter flavus TaxID=3110225 RepID=UPI002DBD4FB7|nr:RNA polymerase sigma factor [Parapedobacter sp. 10938]MEC3878271.1 RNA polymerase sigma factor [Parapedobacter sp. 10938]